MEELIIETKDGVRWLTLNRPHALNALNAALVAALTEAIGQAQADPQIGAIVLTGAGRAFCAGADLKETERRTQEQGSNVAFIRAIGALTELIEAGAKPVIAAVNGIAVAGGLELVLACDIVLAADSARLGDAHANYAMFPGGGATVRLPRRIGIGNAKYVMFTGQSLPASEWVALGLVARAVPADQLAEHAAQLAGQIAGKSPLVIARMKSALNDATDQPAPVAMRRERELNHLHSLSFDRAEGLAAFREKRPPRFQGR
ncbi:enoyl-CoA hydratase/isomerase family protein [Bordetella bronchiseptica]|uniref:Enoyl-CoA hydratase/isomerase n=1 Tax=Bordetella bronchiseptica (strain ATCC BAA-588 / NCTC 13252 / RB50) TaxID=257310 RepID=A0A0H3LIU7_BORBR|nr:enoyl-CoA hydratase-related protein [Bordetella bronchiseptica]KAK66427.1 enoyl-CoA hydratase/isomerase family protein [Bordetella bronchiseptica 980-2]KDD53014.1 enoyl-CoA hydratase/isomerase family protein [Bordetella bronchiseptica OSU553]AMG87559.1 enoyl-CoA hydratase [Bordetella bronchiseptica]KCV46487.1 enoyl-CoA hydratase/isomerase family protein [Bordetella bronchiseptica 3E44]KCV64820.1 enoyl-CoA hydratase/isomerase family protein [Bordetella bronchiseptica 980]